MLYSDELRKSGQNESFPKLYNIFPIDNDELLVGYLFRLANANGFELADLVYVDKTRLTLDVRPKDCNEIPPIKVTATAHHLWRPFEKRWNRIVADDFFYNDPKNSVFYHEIRSCPICQKKEKLKNGYWIFHVSHQVPDAKVCPIHGCALHTWRLKRGKLHDFGQIPVADVALEWEYVNYYLELIHSIKSKTVCFRHTQKLLQKALEHNGTDNMSISQEVPQMFIERLRLGRRSSYGLNPRKTTLLMMKIWPNPYNIEWPIIDSKIDNDFTILETQDGVSLVVHNSCGGKFMTSVQLLSNVPVCPVCSQDFIDGILKSVTNMGYDLIEVTTGTAGLGTMQLRHRECGKIFSVSLNQWAFFGSRCPCRSTAFVRGVEERFIAQLGDEYELLSYDGHFSTIRHKPCDTVFKRAHSKFLLNPHCPMCSPLKTPPESIEIVNKKLSIATDGQFKALEYAGYHKSAIFYHQACKGMFKLNFATFYRRPYCRVCGNSQNKLKLIDPRKMEKK